MPSPAPEYRFSVTADRADEVVNSFAIACDLESSLATTSKAFGLRLAVVAASTFFVVFFLSPYLFAFVS